MLLKRQREIKETLKEESAKKRKKVEQNQRDNFRRHMSGKFAERQTASDLYKSQKACEQLDRSKVSILTEGLFFLCNHLNRLVKLMAKIIEYYWSGYNLFAWKSLVAFFFPSNKNWLKWQYVIYIFYCLVEMEKARDSWSCFLLQRSFVLQWEKKNNLKFVWVYTLLLFIGFTMHWKMVLAWRKRW